MALKFIEECKGIPCEYWKILEMKNSFLGSEPTTTVVLGLYATKEARDANITNFIKHEVYTFNMVDMTREQVYTKLKESSELAAGEYPVLDETGNQIYDENGDPCTVIIPPRKFADAVDC